MKEKFGYSFVKRLSNEETVSLHNLIKYGIWTLVCSVNLTPAEKNLPSVHLSACFISCLK